MPDRVINLILQPCPPLLEFLDFLVRREIDFLFDAVDRFVQCMILIEHSPEILVARFEQLDGFAIFREFSEDRMMKVGRRTHSDFAI